MPRHPRCRLLLLITTAVLAAAPRASASAQSTEIAAAPQAALAGRKSPTFARVIGVLPGVGHIYAGEPGKGFVYLGEMVGVMVLTSLLVVTDCATDAIVGAAEPCPSSLLENVAAAATLGIWGWSIYDAGRAASRTNTRRGIRVSMRLVPTMERRGLSHIASPGALFAIRLGLR